MRLSNLQIEKFQGLYKARFGVDLNKNEAYEKGANLLRLVSLVYKPMTEDEYNELQRRRKETGVYD